MPRIQKKKENKKPVIIEDVEPELEQETETEQAPKDDVKNDAPDPEPEPVAEHRNCLMHEKQSFSSHQPVEEEEEIELVMPKKRTKQNKERVGARPWKRHGSSLRRLQRSVARPSACSPAVGQTP